MIRAITHKASAAVSTTESASDAIHSMMRRMACSLSFIDNYRFFRYNALHHRQSPVMLFDIAGIVETRGALQP